jgi:outer membrane PBP1 activator LpoA protein
MKSRLLHAAGIMLALVGLLAGCSIPTAERPSPPTHAAPAPLTLAERLEQRGDYLGAAQEHLRLAETAAPPERQRHQLRAVSDFIKAGQVEQARRQLQTVDAAGLPAGLAVQRGVLTAELALYDGQPGRAMDTLSRLEPLPNVDPALVAEFYWVRSQGELAMDRPVAAARSLIERERYITSRNDVARNQQQLWDILESTSPTVLRTERYMTYDTVVRGWLDLALLSISYSANPHRLREEIARWQTQYPNHPANRALVPTLTTPERSHIGSIQRIALLLPLTSPFDKAAQAVYDGFMALHQANTDPARPQVRVYDIGADPTLAPAYYDQAVRDGAQFVVGPLGREAAETLARSNRLSAPTLLLTYIEGIALPSNVYQFGLTPEDEAKQVAERAYVEGHRLAAVLLPDTSWGKRMEAAFRRNWENLGGIVLESQTYDPKQSDHSNAIKRLLNIDASERREALLAATLHTKIKFDARRRQDVDVLFMAADAQQGRLLKPQINFFHGLDLPVYSTSEVFTGKPDPINDTDLNGVVFGDMPWMLEREGRIQALRQAIQGEWPNRQTQLDRLYALGVDSYGVIPQLDRLTNDFFARYNGVTGGLTIDRTGRIHRQLVWARFVKGVPELLDTFYSHKGQWNGGDETGSASTPFAGTTGGEAILRLPAPAGLAPGGT